MQYGAFRMRGLFCPVKRFYHKDRLRDLTPTHTNSRQLQGALKLMLDLMLFTDGSLDPCSRVGFGAYLIVSNTELSLASLKTSIVVKRFEDTSSTQLELLTLLWALSDPQLLAGEEKLTIYTDSKNITGLPARRERLEKNNYYSAANQQLRDFALYQQFFGMIDRLNCQLIKVVGHQAASKKDYIDQLFTLVDRASRSAMRDYNHMR